MMFVLKQTFISSYFPKKKIQDQGHFKTLTNCKEQRSRKIQFLIGILGNLNIMLIIYVVFVVSGIVYLRFQLSGHNFSIYIHRIISHKNNSSSLPNYYIPQKMSTHLILYSLKCFTCHKHFSNY